MVSARKRLGRGSELYAEFSALLIDLMHGDLSSLDRIDAGSSSATRPARTTYSSKSHDGPAKCPGGDAGQHGHAFHPVGRLVG